MARGLVSETAGKTWRERKPYGRLTPAQWGEVLALFAAGATAKALAARFGTTERTPWSGR